MHRLNALQITAFPEREKKTPETACFALFTCLPASCRRWREDAHNQHAVVRLWECACVCMCVCVCVCQASAERIKETDGQNLSNVVSDFIHSRWREEERGGRGGRKTTHGGGKVGTNPPSHGQTRPGLHPSPFNANQSQGCQLRSTCTPPARKPLPDKSPLITRLCGGAASSRVCLCDGNVWFMF